MAPAVAFAAAVAPGAFPRACVQSSVNVLPIDVSAAAPNGDGLDHIDSANVSAQICASSHGRGPGQPSVPLTPCASVCFTIFHLNPRGLRCPPQNLAKVDALLCSLNTPDFVAITETQLDLGTAVCCLSGYHVVSRLDRRQGLRTDAGGIAFFVRDGLQNQVVHIGDSDVDERSWHVIHANSGPILVCVWYRRPNVGEIGSIQRFAAEYDRHSKHGVSFIAVGDFNVHNPSWLRFSRADSLEGSELEHECCTRGFLQHVKSPTRGAYLLDLVISDFRSGITCKVTPGIHDNDHCGVLTKINLDIPDSDPVRRQVYKFRIANWEQLRGSFLGHDWAQHLVGTADDAAASITQQILDMVSMHIPQTWIIDKVYAHPWLNAACQRALEKKIAAEGTVDFPRLRDECSEIFLKARRDFVFKTRGTLQNMSSSSRGWWKLAGSLLARAGTRETVPPLLRPDESWALTAEEKAEEIARVFKAKSVLQPAETNIYSDIPERSAADMRPGFLRLRVRTVYKILKNLDESSGTGPDLLPARILKRMACELALPITLLARKILREHRWPDCWRNHWIHALFKKGEESLGRNYRGVHLTAQLSKVIERAIGTLFIPWLESTGAFGPHQYAYTKGRGYKDTLAVNVCNWLLLLEQGFLVAVYCSDVSGAFDRVSQDRLIAKLRTLGLHDDILGFLISWLADRSSKVVLGGHHSAAEVLANSVYQGTVLGPPLWNVFYSDSKAPVRKCGYTETAFADDLNCWKAFGIPPKPEGMRGPLPGHGRILADLRSVQHELHMWGRANQVTFDPAKESFHVLHRSLQFGENFKVLGCVFDTQLQMHAAARHVATEAGWRLQTLLRSRRFFSPKEIVHLYKAQVLSFIESSTPGLYHAAPSTLERIDRVQRRFLREVGLSEFEALRDHKLAPLSSRRDMAMLGLLHRVTLGLAPPQFATLFPVRGAVDEPALRHQLRYWRPLHSRQLTTPANFRSSDVLKRSVFGIALCYNKLPQRIVDSKTVKQFQSTLQHGLLCFAERRIAHGLGWERLFSADWRVLQRTQLDEYFSH